MVNSKAKNFIKKSSFLALGLLTTFQLAACSSSVSETSSTPNPKEVAFQTQAKEHFDSIQNAWNETGELDSIVCDPADCHSTIYFNFNKLPIDGTDLKGAMRLNAATFSTLEWKALGSSNVTFIAKVQGKETVSCAAKDGIGKDCKDL